MKDLNDNFSIKFSGGYVLLTSKVEKQILGGGRQYAGDCDCNHFRFQTILGQGTEKKVIGDVVA